MTFYYIPHPDRAYDSVRAITEDIYLGWFIRGLHKMSVNLMILFLTFHVLRVFITRAYRNGAMKWVVGGFVFFTTLALGFTGYSLVYDNVSYWGMTVVTTMIGEIPLVGKPLLYLLRGGEEITELTLLRLYDLHTKLLPFLLIVLITVHILVIRILGFAEVDGLRGMHRFYPEHLLKTGIISLGLLIVMVNLTIFFPPGLGPPANPQEVAADVSPPWYFLGVYRWITIAPREPALTTILIVSGLFIIYPYVDRFFEKRGYDMTRINITLAVSAVSVFILLTLWEAVW